MHISGEKTALAQAKMQNGRPSIILDTCGLTSVKIIVISDQNTSSPPCERPREAGTLQIDIL